MPDERLGEKACAYIVLENTKINLTLEMIKAYLGKNDVSKMKYPERIEIVEAIPHTASGKVQKNVLRKDIKEKLEKEIKNITIGM